MKRDLRACVCVVWDLCVGLTCVVGRSDIVHVVGYNCTARLSEHLRTLKHTQLWRHSTGCPVFSDCWVWACLASPVSQLFVRSFRKRRLRLCFLHRCELRPRSRLYVCVQQVFLHWIAWPHWLTQANRFSPMNRFFWGGIRSSTVIPFSFSSLFVKPWKSSVVSLLKQHIENVSIV